MWISRKEYDKLMDEKKSLIADVRYKNTMWRNYYKKHDDILIENARMREQLDELKVKYADEVRKNFELASYLSETKN